MVISYTVYLTSAAWRRIAEEAKRIAGYRCQICMSSIGVEAHHRTYERLGHERLADIVIMCRGCHARFHDRIPGPAEQLLLPIEIPAIKAA